MKHSLMIILTAALLLTGCSSGASIADLSSEQSSAADSVTENTAAETTAEQTALPMREITCFRHVTVRFPENAAFLSPDTFRNTENEFLAAKPVCLIAALDGTYNWLEFERCVRDLEGQPPDTMLRRIARDSFGMDEAEQAAYSEVPNKNGIRIWKMVYTRPFADADGTYFTHTRYAAEYHRNYYIMNWTLEGSNPQEAALHDVLGAMEIDDSALQYTYDPDNDQSENTGLCYERLSAEDRQIYDEIYRTVNPDSALSHPVWTRAGCPEAELNRLQRIAEAVDSDHFENSMYFYYDIRQEGDTFSVSFAQESAEYEADSAYGLKTAEEKSDAILAAMPDSLTRYGKYLYLAKALCALTEYNDTDTGYNTYSIRGVFEEGKTVCQGYAEAYAFLCKRAGLFCMFVTGNGHAWNVIRLNGELYYMDVTWMDDVVGDDMYHPDYDQPFTSENTLHAVEDGGMGLSAVWCDELAGVLQTTGQIDWDAEQAAPVLQ